jgi:hypothetical protein
MNCGLNLPVDAGPREGWQRQPAARQGEGYSGQPDGGATVSSRSHGGQSPPARHEEIVSGQSQKALQYM